jgi:hypothetical protein
MKIAFQYKVAHITWIDSSGVRGWNPVNEEDDLSLIDSVGIIARETKDSITVSTSHSENDNFYSALTIPRFAIVKMKYLK